MILLGFGPNLIKGIACAVPAEGECGTPSGRFQVTLFRGLARPRTNLLEIFHPLRRARLLAWWVGCLLACLLACVLGCWLGCSLARAVARSLACLCLLACLLACLPACLAGWLLACLLACLLALLALLACLFACLPACLPLASRADWPLCVRPVNSDT